MNRQAMSTLNLVFALVIFVAAIALMAFGDNKTVPIALLPVGFANLTIGLIGRNKADS